MTQMVLIKTITIVPITIHVFANEFRLNAHLFYA